MVDDPGRSPAAVAVRVGERARIDLVEDAGLPPRGRRVQAWSKPGHQPVGNGCQWFTTTQHTPWGMWFIGNLHWVDGGELVCSLTTRYWVGP